MPDSDVPGDITAGGRHRAKRRFAPLVWLGSLAAAGLLVLGVSGTLSGWTSAIVHNGANTAGAATAVALSETNPGATTPITCDTVTEPTNEVDCAIDKYGGNLAMSPGDVSTVDVTFTNTGTGPASRLTLAPGTCTDSTGGTLCTDGNLSVAMGCSDGATFNSGSAYTDLVYAPTAPGDLTSVSHTATIAAGAQISCEFTTTLSADSPASVAGFSVSQPLTWTLAA